MQVWTWQDGAGRGRSGLVGAGRGAGTFVHPDDQHASSDCLMFADTSMENKSWFMENKFWFKEYKDTYGK
jgi:hypothetical protein